MAPQNGCGFLLRKGSGNGGVGSAVMGLLRLTSTLHGMTIWIIRITLRIWLIKGDSYLEGMETQMKYKNLVQLIQIPIYQKMKVKKIALGLCFGGIVLHSPDVEAICNIYGCTPGPYECNIHGCPQDNNYNPLDTIRDAERILLEELMRRSRNSQTRQLPRGCYEATDGSSFCFISVYTTSNPNIKKVSFKMDGVVYNSLFIDCVNRVISNGFRSRRKFNTNSVYFKACTDYN
jgi:hypothetical protein